MDSSTEEQQKAGKFLTVLPQILASSAKNLLFFDLGTTFVFATIVIPVLRNSDKEDSDEILYLTDEQASWFGSIIFIFRLVGSLGSGWLTERLGRKRAMIIVNIPQCLAWLLMYTADSLVHLYLGIILLGFGGGIMEAPAITYIAEICEPSIRGILIATTNIFVTLGMTTVFTLAKFVKWRQVALIILSVPIIAIVAICFVPETPMWLLSKNRDEEALKSLQWLRGWVSPTAVETEFNEIKRYSENSKKCIECQKSNIICTHPPPKFKDKLRELFHMRNIKAFIIVIGLFLIGNFSGVLSMRPFLFQIFKAYNIPIDISEALIYYGHIQLIANIATTLTIHLLGKKRLCLICLFAATICCTCLVVYAEINFPPNYNSFDKDAIVSFDSSSLPLVTFCFLNFFTSTGVSCIAWFLLSEIFPFKSRGYATGTGAGLGYMVGFVSTKTYVNFDKGLNLKGVMWFYTAVNLTGILFVYFIMPETENRTLEDIEAHFSDKSKHIWNNKIEKINN